LKRAQEKRLEQRFQFLPYLDLEGTEKEIDLERLERTGEGASGSNRHEKLFFSSDTDPEAPIILAYLPPGRDGNQSVKRKQSMRRKPTTFQITALEAYWWTTTGGIEWFGRRFQPLKDEQRNDIRNAKGRPGFLLSYPGPNTGRIAAWRRNKLEIGPPAEKPTPEASHEQAAGTEIRPTAGADAATL
jgi:hypothetical protein